MNKEEEKETLLAATAVVNATTTTTAAAATRAPSRQPPENEENNRKEKTAVPTAAGSYQEEEEERNESAKEEFQNNNNNNKEFFPEKEEETKGLLVLDGEEDDDDDAAANRVESTLAVAAAASIKVTRFAEAATTSVSTPARNHRNNNNKNNNTLLYAGDPLSPPPASASSLLALSSSDSSLSRRGQGGLRSPPPRAAFDYLNHNNNTNNNGDALQNKNNHHDPYAHYSMDELYRLVQEETAEDDRLLGNYFEQQQQQHQHRHKRLVSDRSFHATRNLTATTTTSSSSSMNMILAGAVSNLCSATLGAGVLALPFAFLRAGIVAGLVLLFASAGSTLASVSLIVQACQTYHLYTYESLTYHLFGARARTVVEVCILIFCMGCAVAYLITMADLLEQCQLLFVYGSRTYTMLTVWTCCMLPLSLLKRMQALQAFSAVGLCSIGTLVFAAAIHLLVDIYYSGSNNDVDHSNTNVSNTTALDYSYDMDKLEWVTPLSPLLLSVDPWHRYRSYHDRLDVLMSSSSSSTNNTHPHVRLQDFFWPLHDAQGSLVSYLQSILTACPIILFAFSCQVNVCAIFQELPAVLPPTADEDEPDDDHHDGNHRNRNAQGRTDVRHGGAVAAATSMDTDDASSVPEPMFRVTSSHISILHWMGGGGGSSMRLLHFGKSSGVQEEEEQQHDAEAVVNAEHHGPPLGGESGDDYAVGSSIILSHHNDAAEQQPQSPQQEQQQQQQQQQQSGGTENDDPPTDEQNQDAAAEQLQHQLAVAKQALMQRTTRTAVYICSALYASISILALADFGDSVTPNILSRYDDNISSSSSSSSKSSSNPHVVALQSLMQVATAAMAFAVVMAFPLNIFPARVTLMEILYPTADTNNNNANQQEPSAPTATRADGNGPPPKQDNNPVERQARRPLVGNAALTAALLDDYQGDDILEQGDQEQGGGVGGEAADVGIGSLRDETTTMTSPAADTATTTNVDTLLLASTNQEEPLSNGDVVGEANLNNADQLDTPCPAVQQPTEDPENRNENGDRVNARESENDELYYWRDLRRHVVVTVCLSGTALILSLLLPDISVVFGVLGGTTTSILGFCVPGLLGIRLCRDHSHAFERDESAWTVAGRIFTSWLLLIGGALIGIVTTAVTIYSLLVGVDHDNNDNNNSNLFRF